MVPKGFKTGLGFSGRGSYINWSDPITRGLIHFITPIGDLVTKRTPFLGTSTGLRPGDRLALAPTTNLSACANFGPLNTRILAKAAFTEVALCRPDSVAARRCPWDGGSSTAPIGLGMGYTTPGRIFMYWGKNSGGWVSEQTDNYWVVNQEVLAACSYDYNASTRAWFYKNGVKLATPTVNTPSAPDTVADNKLGWGDNTNLVGWSGEVKFVGIWDRMLRDDEHMSLGIAPWRFVVPAIAQIWAPPGWNAVWAARMSGIIGAGRR